MSSRLKTPLFDPRVDETVDLDENVGNVGELLNARINNEREPDHATREIEK